MLPLKAMARLLQAWPFLAALAALGPSTRAARVIKPGQPPASALQPADSGFSFSRQPIRDVKVWAENVDGIADVQGLIHATGHVRAVLTQAPEPGGEPAVTVVTADELTADLGSKVLTADGSVTVESGSRTARGERLEYHWADQTGRVESVELHQYGLAFRARSLTATPNGQMILNAEFSTCGLDDPDYAIHAKRVEVTPNKRIVAHGVTVELFQRRIITVPRLQYSLRNGRAHSPAGLPVPRPGYSRVSGFSIAQPLPVGENLIAEIEPTTRVGIRGRLTWDPDGVVAPYAAAEWKQERGVRARDPVLVSTLPMVGLHIGRKRELDLSAGYYVEQPTNTRESRASLAWRQTLLDRGTRAGLRLSVDARVSAYSNGDVYRTAGFEAAVGRGDQDVFEEVGIRLNGLQGHTPFLWDNVQMQTEVFGAKRIPWGNYRLEGAVSYDMQRHEWYDVQIGVARRFKCLEPEIRYSTRRRFILLRLKVLGLE